MWLPHPPSSFPPIVRQIKSFPPQLRFRAETRISYYNYRPKSQ